MSDADPEVTPSKNKLIAMLEELLKSEPAQEKKQKLSDEYGFIMTTDTERRVNYMCNLSEVIIERVIEEGMEKGDYSKEYFHLCVKR